MDGNEIMANRISENLTKQSKMTRRGRMYNDMHN